MSFDLGDAADDADDDEEEVEEESTEKTADQEEPADPPEKTPAFGFENQWQRQLYPRPESWERLEDAMTLDMERVFREHGVRNMSKREIHDALVRFSAAHAEEVARLALEERGVDIEE
ncbi:hypothetical protein [Halomarina oriensis]|uniref:Uncharacterized protein n=1 Tax=Halomarina oriensis TaxID=671145 RepID=A0A6B0GN60_9EURY|nr:hypothetical protein [Halomarina oriensis]MWG36214.1 hypothetical protein [Halomarina oriensis]